MKTEQLHGSEQCSGEHQHSSCNGLTKARSYIAITHCSDRFDG